MLNPDQVRKRDGKLGASMVRCLMTGDADEILNLWRELVGDPAFVREDLSGVWPVQLGSCTENLNLDWYERRTGKPLSKRGKWVNHPEFEWAGATLDGWDDDLQCAVECKHVGGFEKTATVLERYAPQAHWQMIVTGSKQCVFSIIEGAREPVIEIVSYDDDYAKTLWSRALEFWLCVETLTPPVAPKPVAAPVKAEKLYDMTGSNQWASEAVTWIKTRQAWRDNVAADKAIKQMVAADAAKCIGHGIEASRNRAGSITIRERE